MLAFDDERWVGLTGGYRSPIDVRPLLIRLESGEDDKAVWGDLWDELHHQGDVGEASYAAVPHLVRNCGSRRYVDWNLFAIVTIIELARTDGNNPEVPAWLKIDYFQAIQELAEFGASQILRAEGEDCVRSILALIAIARNLRVQGEFLVNYSADELLDMRRRSEESDL
jgi:hypothetical protein